VGGRLEQLKLDREDAIKHTVGLLKSTLNFFQVPNKYTNKYNDK